MKIGFIFHAICIKSVKIFICQGKFLLHVLVWHSNIKKKFGYCYVINLLNPNFQNDGRSGTSWSMVTRSKGKFFLKWSYNIQGITNESLQVLSQNCKIQVFRIFLAFTTALNSIHFKRWSPNALALYQTNLGFENNC